MLQTGLLLMFDVSKRALRSLTLFEFFFFFLIYFIVYGDLMVFELWINLMTLWLIHFILALPGHSFVLRLQSPMFLERLIRPDLF